MDGARSIWTVVKTGRVLDGVDLDGRRARRGRRARVFRMIGRLVVGTTAVSATLLAGIMLLALASDQSAQNAYDKAPYCATGTASTDSCVLRTTASVSHVEVSKNTGKNAHGYTTTVDLAPAADLGRSQRVELSDTEDVSDAVGSGDVLPVLVWRGEITRFTFSGTTHDADENPHGLVAWDLGESATLLFVAVVAGRPLMRRLMRDRMAINLRRNRIPDWTLVVLGLLAVPVAAILRASYAVVTLGWVAIAILLLAVAWPFFPWVATVPEKQRPLLGASQSSNNRNRKPAKKKLP